MVECPKCKSIEIDVYDSDGGLSDGYILDKSCCMECGTDFMVHGTCKVEKITDVVFGESDEQ